jgi:Fe-S cluster biogenesis protein NfuA
MPNEEIDVPERMRRIGELVHQIDSEAEPRFRERAVELMTLLMEVHGAGLERMVAILSGSSAGRAAVDSFATDPLVNSLLLLYGLHPVDFETRIGQALDKVRPYLQSHGGNVELLGIEEEGVVRLKLAGSCHGCPSSALTLKNAIEEAIFEFAPDVSELRVEGAVAASEPKGFVPLTQIAVL